MRTQLAIVTASLLAAFALSAVPAQAGAGPLDGTLEDATGAHPAVAGATVRLREVTPSGPGTVVATDTTDADGYFSLDAGASPDDEYYVQVLPGRYQGGYVGGSPLYVQPSADYAATYGPHTRLGTIWANPAFIRGIAVEAGTGRRLAGVRVTARSATDVTAVEGADTTNRRGVFMITGLTCEDDCYLKLNGSPSHEVGFRACNGGVVPTWGAACASPIGLIGKVRLDKS